MDENFDRVNEKEYRRKRMKGKKGRSFMGGKGSQRYHNFYTTMYEEIKGYITKQKNEFYDSDFLDEEFENNPNLVRNQVNDTTEMIASKMENELTYSLNKKKRWEIFEKVQVEEYFGGTIIDNAYCKKHRGVNYWWGYHRNGKGIFTFKGKTFQVGSTEHEIKKSDSQPYFYYYQDHNKDEEEEDNEIQIHPPSKHKKNKKKWKTYTQGYPNGKKKRNKKRRRRYRCGKKNPKSTIYYTPVLIRQGRFRSSINYDHEEEKKKKMMKIGSGTKKEFLEFMKRKPDFFLFEIADKKCAYRHQQVMGRDRDREYRDKKKKKQMIQREIQRRQFEDLKEN